LEAAEDYSSNLFLCIDIDVIVFDAWIRSKGNFVGLIMHFTKK